MTSTSDVNWSADIIPRIGYSTGKLSFSFGAGLSVAGRTGKLNVGGQSMSETNRHVGWKVAPALDVALTEDATLSLQVHYAEYDDEEYFGTPVGEIRSTSARLAMLYRF